MKRKLTTVPLPQSEPGYNTAPLLGKLIKAAVWIILVFTIAVVVLYIAGSYRKISADSLLALVRLGLILSQLLIISSVYGLILDIIYIVSKKKTAYIAGIAGYLLTMVFGGVVTLSMAFIIGAVGGNTG